MEKPILVGLLGLGTVGSGVVKIMENHQEKLMHQVGCPVKVKKILVRDVQKPRDVAVDPSLLTTSAAEVIDDPDIDVIIEVMGGIEETKEWLLRALRQGKHVVTANKDLMAVYGSELLRVAAEYRCDLFYEASVAGGIPILRSLVDGLASDRITKLMGIVNGTTNYILTKMSQNGASYEDVLAEAQALGFAEADPTSDVEGLDAARKMAILARLGFSMDIDLDDVQVKGITQVTEEDLNYGKRLGYTMKLIGIAQRDGQKVEVSVQPTFLPDSHPLASVHNEYNAVYVYGEAVGETMFYGPGAGSLPTATAVVSDLVAVMKNMRLGVNGHSAVAPQYEKQLKAPAEIFSKYFLRIHVKDQVGAFAKITTLFSKRGVSFEKILQLPLKEDGLAEIVIVTHDASQQDYEDILQQLGDLEIVERVQSSYRVEGEKR
ncbi:MULTISPECIES: homoserine dehydrogenase [Geobacillus]|uniref:Homoserine dehydrogenase n=1 Tax=Geobacillus thermocatenulatus TaxID=33938 RepID=A0A226Q9E7_9BACL|nr:MULTISPECIES: homoserine dehydrogenase [Geobacillus]KPD00567.1 Homoserine dehydrogenase [Geobacillus sp. BCO2]RAN22317.1 homoserine dehydrogenase [Geobacillus sp. A8]ASS98343.1 homoserine dehydrogenase [Geobacillus thermocatenulatus]KLR74266.1 homoserine dehydrogenase [Geobacillus sp. T6]OXB89103.1 homoserine dehydrogenase [Geobacillus thermocatenulatus]